MEMNDYIDMYKICTNLLSFSVGCPKLNICSMNKYIVYRACVYSKRIWLMVVSESLTTASKFFLSLLSKPFDQCNFQSQQKTWCRLIDPNDYLYGHKWYRFIR